jgi:4-hydroxybenzoyl-CoA reductase subunit beta
MLLPPHEFVKPATLAEGLALLHDARGSVQLMGGGTDVVFNMRGRLLQPDVLLSLRGLPDLQGVVEGPDGSIRIGAGCRLTDLIAEPLIRDRFPALAEACRAVASRHVRNMATLGGNLCLDTRCWFTNQTEEWRMAKGPCLKTGSRDCHVIRGATTCVALNNADTPPALIALNAAVTLRRLDGERTLPLAEFYRDDGVNHTVREPDEILSLVTVPACHDRLIYIKDTARQGIDFAYGSIAARADGRGEQASSVQLILGSLSTRPIALTAAARIIEEQGLSDTGIELAGAAVRADLGPLNNLYTPASYKRQLARSLVQRALIRLREMSS